MLSSDDEPRFGIIPPVITSTARACDWVTRGAFAAAGGSAFVALKLFESWPASDGVSERVTGGATPVNRAC